MKHSNYLVKRAALERGATEQEADETSRWLAFVDIFYKWGLSDLVGRKAIDILGKNKGFAGSLGKFISTVSRSKLPLAQMAYLTWSGVKNPFKTLRAARETTLAAFGFAPAPPPRGTDIGAGPGGRGRTGDAVELTKDAAHWRYMLAQMRQYDRHINIEDVEDRLRQRLELEPNSDKINLVIPGLGGEDRVFRTDSRSLGRILRFQDYMRRNPDRFLRHQLHDMGLQGSGPLGMGSSTPESMGMSDRHNILLRRIGLNGVVHSPFDLGGGTAEVMSGPMDAPLADVTKRLERYQELKRLMGSRTKAAKRVAREMAAASMTRANDEALEAGLGRMHRSALMTITRDINRYHPGYDAAHFVDHLEASLKANPPIPGIIGKADKIEVVIPSLNGSPGGTFSAGRKKLQFLVKYLKREWTPKVRMK